MAAASILLVSNDDEAIGAVKRIVSDLGYDLYIAESLDEVSLRRLDRVCDAMLLQTDGLQDSALNRLADSGFYLCGLPVVAIARNRSIHDAVRFIQAGAVEYMPIDPVDPVRFSEALHQALARGKADRCADEEPALPEGFISTDQYIRNAWRLLLTVADSKTPILITGENGSGKSTLAHALHANSSRRTKPVVEVNCGVLSGGHLESELFGEAYGPTMSESIDRIGKIETAHGGTVLIDEIGNASEHLQTRLMRFLETGEFERVGERFARHSDVRIIASSRGTMDDRFREGRFRADLYERLSELRVDITPLRERVSDVPVLARKFTAEFSRRHGRAVTVIAPQALERLVHYSWPGNVRELKNMMEYAVIMSRSGVLEVEDLPRRIAESAPQQRSTLSTPQPLREALRDPERRCILRALELTGGNKQHAAAGLGISRSTLYKKMKELGLEPAEVPLQPAS